MSVKAKTIVSRLLIDDRTTPYTSLSSPRQVMVLTDHATD